MILQRREIERPGIGIEPDVMHTQQTLLLKIARSEESIDAYLPYLESAFPMDLIFKLEKERPKLLTPDFKSNLFIIYLLTTLDSSLTLDTLYILKQKVKARLHTLDPHTPAASRFVDFSCVIETRIIEEEFKLCTTDKSYIEIADIILACQEKVKLKQKEFIQASDWIQHLEQITILFDFNLTLMESMNQLASNQLSPYQFSTQLLGKLTLLYNKNIIEETFIKEIYETLSGLYPYTVKQMGSFVQPAPKNYEEKVLPTQTSEVSRSLSYYIQKLKILSAKMQDHANIQPHISDTVLYSKYAFDLLRLISSLEQDQIPFSQSHTFENLAKIINLLSSWDEDLQGIDEYQDYLSATKEMIATMLGHCIHVFNKSSHDISLDDFSNTVFIIVNEMLSQPNINDIPHLGAFASDMLANWSAYISSSEQHMQYDVLLDCLPTLKRLKGRTPKISRGIINHLLDYLDRELSLILLPLKLHSKPSKLHEEDILLTEVHLASLILNIKQQLYFQEDPVSTIPSLRVAIKCIQRIKRLNTNILPQKDEDRITSYGNSLKEIDSVLQDQTLPANIKSALNDLAYQLMQNILFFQDHKTCDDYLYVTTNMTYTLQGYTKRLLEQLTHHLETIHISQLQRLLILQIYTLNNTISFLDKRNASPEEKHLLALLHHLKQLASHAHCLIEREHKHAVYEIVKLLNHANILTHDYRQNKLTLTDFLKRGEQHLNRAYKHLSHHRGKKQRNCNIAMCCTIIGAILIYIDKLCNNDKQKWTVVSTQSSQYVENARTTLQNCSKALAKTQARQAISLNISSH